FSSACSPGHLALASFPTRRSSDLLDRLPNLMADFRLCHRESARVHASPAVHAPFATTGFLRSQFRIPREPPREDQKAGVRHHAVDRKSTRLNSSHEWTSYAVFCLK